MKKNIILSLTICCLRLCGALEFGAENYLPGWWFGISNDSFGIGVPSEADDLHTHGFYGGYKTESFSGSLAYDIYTNRGTNAGEPTRTDRLKVSLGRKDLLDFKQVQLYWEVAGCLGLDGNLGGYYVQHLFHNVFLNHRPIPGFSDFDSMQLFFGVEPHAELAMGPEDFKFGLELDVLVTYPWLAAFDPGLFLMARRGDSMMRFSASWFFTPVSEDYKTYGIVRDMSGGLWLNGYLSGGELFYHFSYNPIRQIANGRIGYQWTKKPRTPVAPLWDMMEVGIELFNLGAGVIYEENNGFELFFRSGLPGGYYDISVKNGGLYADNVYNIRNTILGFGYEQHLHVIPEKKHFFDPFIGWNLFIEHLREHDYTLYRSTTKGDMGIIGSELRAGFYIWMPALPGHTDETGFRLSSFLTLPHITFGEGESLPGMTLARELRWGIRAGFAARP